MNPLDRDVFHKILATLPDDWKSRQLYLGRNWTLSVVSIEERAERAGLAATPSAEEVAAQTRFAYGANDMVIAGTAVLGQYLQSDEPVVAAVGLATLNALLRPNPEHLEDIDAGDWLLERSRDKGVALIGRFPFAEELKPITSQLWVFELEPKPDEYGTNELAAVIPQADILAITSSTLVNQTLADILALVQPETTVMLLGPSTPLTPALFDLGIDLLSGVLVEDVAAVMTAVAAGTTFRHMSGLRRVTLRRKEKLGARGEQ